VAGGVYKATVDTARGRQYIRAQAGDVVLWPAGSEDTDESEPGRPLRAFSMEFRWPGMPPELPFLVRDTEHTIDQLANRLLARAHDPMRKGVLDWVAHAYLAAMLAEFAALAETAAVTLVSRAAHYTEEHMRERIRRADLARHAGMDPHHFGRKYLQLTGRTPMEDVRRRKAAYAKHVLTLSPAFSLSHVAKLAGVRDASAVSRLLTRYTGVSARDIKKAARKR
jgi:AraC-like DNA-binding protein